MIKVTTGAVVNEKPPTKEEIIEEWKRNAIEKEIQSPWRTCPDLFIFTLEKFIRRMCRRDKAV
ncbi:hypothetical protein J2Z22_004764 [Paenibacillus forsythiae]|uniref:Uncharacterized protein n=1 Tax=Paenibacillus forsythiae TaxID=365616 RepID=A0ABU3HEA5_9BACL|nr:hypothetical protein [Paenibacillus forsythiae]MDT3429164.1 hypothetical protein [Paenibacillus forsythiae]